MKDPSSCGRGSSVNSSLVDRFTSDAGRGIHVCVADCVCVGVGNPSHLSFSSAHVRSRNVDGWAKEALLCQLQGEPPCNPFELVLGILLGVDFEPCFSATKRNIDTGAFVRH